MNIVPAELHRKTRDRGDFHSAGLGEGLA